MAIVATCVRCLAAAFALSAAVGLSGCATYSQTHGPIQASLAAGQPEVALAFLEQRRVRDRDLPLHLLNKAMLLRLSGDYSGSNAAFEEAKRLIEALSTASVSEAAASFIINDGSRSYVGEPFELPLVHAYAALNYLALGDVEAARVEALQIDVLLRALAEDETAPEGNEPFARYLSGLIYEIGGEWSDALIAYRKSMEAYQAAGSAYASDVPSFLRSDLLRLTAHLELADEHENLGVSWSEEDWIPQTEYRENGELVFIFGNGLAPIKRERTLVIYPPQAERIVTIALPYYEPRPSPVASAKLVLGERSASVETVENVTALALKTLEARMPAMTARAIVRAVAKYKIASHAGRENGAAAGFAAHMAGLFTERADTRSWLTLPGEIGVARLPAPPGEYKPRLELYSSTGTLLATREFDVTLEPGKKQIISYHWVPQYEGK